MIRMHAEGPPVVPSELSTHVRIHIFREMTTDPQLMPAWNEYLRLFDKCETRIEESAINRYIWQAPLDDYQWSKRGSKQSRG